SARRSAATLGAALLPSIDGSAGRGVARKPRQRAAALDSRAKQLRDRGFDGRRVGRVARASMPFAASLGKDDAATLKLESTAEVLDVSDGPSGLSRA